MADRSVSVPMTLSNQLIERRDVRGQIFRRISLITLVPFENDQIRQDNTWGRKRNTFLGGQPRPYRNGWCSSAPNLGRSQRRPHAFDAELPNLTWQHVGRGTYFTGQSRPTPWGRDPSAPQFDVLLNKHAVICFHLGGSFLFVRTPFVTELAI